MYEKKLRVAKSVLVAATLATIFWVSAGSLTPPAGPIAATPGPEPRVPINSTTAPGDANSRFKITQPGSYYLTGNITGAVGKNGIGIAASGVTLDLNGFDLLGIALSLDGVSVTANGLTNIAVVNGSVRSWGGDGVDLGTFTAANCRVADLLASGNLGNGIRTGIGSTVSNCSAYVNHGDGISTSLGCTVSNCSAYNNYTNGFSVNNSCTVSNCSAHGNTGDGISTSLGCTVSNCSASDNCGNGINVSNGSSVVDCTARLNILDGIRCSAGCMIRGNTCNNNGLSAGDGAGIHVTGADNRIEGNNCTDADRGIDVDVAGNLIIKNSCSGNAIDWVFVANTVFGPIIDRRAPASAAVSGFTAASSLASTDPNANFSY